MEMRVTGYQGATAKKELCRIVTIPGYVCTGTGYVRARDGSDQQVIGTWYLRYDKNLRVLLSYRSIRPGTYSIRQSHASVSCMSHLLLYGTSLLTCRSIYQVRRRYYASFMPKCRVCSTVIPVC